MGIIQIGSGVWDLVLIMNLLPLKPHFNLVSLIIVGLTLPNSNLWKIKIVQVELELEPGYQVINIHNLHTVQHILKI